MSKKSKKKNKTKIIVTLIIVLLIISNLLLVWTIIKPKKDSATNSEFIYKVNIEGKYDNKTKYYIPISYSQYNKLLKNKEVFTLAVIDNSSNTYDKFLELINKLAFFKNTKIYLLETSKLSKKNTVSFYNLDERLSSLESNYIISIYNKKVISITEFNNENLINLIKGMEN